MKDIIECIQGFASPMNTLGMGDINPSTDFIGISIKRNKHRKKKMKNLKDVLKSKLFESLNSDNLPSKKWKPEDLNEFLSNILSYFLEIIMTLLMNILLISMIQILKE